MNIFIISFQNLCRTHTNGLNYICKNGRGSEFLPALTPTLFKETI